MAIATTNDVATSMLRALTDSEKQLAEKLLERAENRLLGRISNLAERAEKSKPFAGMVAEIEAEAVARVLRAPDGAIYRSETEGEYNYNLNTAVATGLLDITDAEWSRLLGPYGSAAPATDGYLRSRYGLDPAWAFQYGWPDVGAP